VRWRALLAKATLRTSATRSGVALAYGAAMTIGKLWFVAILSAAVPAVAHAQVNVSVGIDIDANAYDSSAPGDPVEDVDVFYDQLQPYGVWVDEPDIGRVFIPSQDNFVPYTTGHWEYTRLGFVWVSSEPFGWATSHYGRWAYSNPYGRWVWLPDTEWGPAWVEWRQTSDHFGWAPLPPARVAYNYAPPVESWHYCGSAHILDANVTRYYEPRDRVVVIQREARPVEHYQTVGNVKVVVGPPPSMLRDHRVEARPVQVNQRIVGRWSAPEAHAQVQRAQEHKATFEVDNQKRVQANTRINTAQSKVIETHPQIKVQADARLEAAKTGKVAPRPEPARVEQRPTPPPQGRVEPARPATPPQHAEPARPMQGHVEPARPATPPPQHAEPTRPTEPARPATPPQRAEPTRPTEPVRPATPPREQRPAPPPQSHVEPARPATPPQHAEPARPAEPVRPATPPQGQPAKPAGKPAEHREPEKKN
jgi:hypothetical protein